MNKEKFIIELRKRLSLLSNEEIDKNVEEYLSYINQKINEGKSEEEAIKELGDVNQIAKRILTSYKINEKYIKLFIGKEKVIDEINEFVNKVEDTVTEIAKKTGEMAKNVFESTKKFSKEKFTEVKKFIKKKFNEDEADDLSDEEYEIID